MYIYTMCLLLRYWLYMNSMTFGIINIVCVYIYNLKKYYIYIYIYIYIYVCVCIMKLGTRLGRTISKEQYAYIYKVSSLELLDAYEFNDTWYYQYCVCTYI